MLDTETTGLSKEKDRILEIAVLETDDDGNPTGNHFHRYINPQRDIPEEAAKVHGINNETVKDCPTFDQIVVEFIDFVQDREVVIHNARYDVGMLDAEFARLGLGEFSSYVSDVTDTLVMSRSLVKASKHDLDTLCDRYGVDRSKRTLHGALMDCEMLGLVYPHLVRLEQELHAKLTAMLGFTAQDPAELGTDEAARRYLELASLNKALAKLQKPYSAYIGEQAGGMDLLGEGFLVEYGSQVRTKWEKVVAEHLEGVDLAPYRTETSTMSIKAR
jgi:DNA polymerase-3 subunit epsilon